MSFNYNYTVLVGRLTRDPDFKQITETFCRLSFTLAIGRRGKHDSHEQDTDFIPINVLGNLAAVGSQLLRKGTPVLIWGRIQVKSYEKEGVKKWITEIVAENFQVLERLGQRDKAVEDIEAAKEVIEDLA